MGGRGFARVRRWLPRAAAAALTLAAGFALGGRFGHRFAERFDGGFDLAASNAPAFHDMRVLPPEEFRSLVTPGAPAVAALARRLGTLEAAYLFVRDRIAFDPASAAGAPAETLAAGRASCLGKATLLVSLYRALGVPASDVRVVTGQVPYEGALLEHAWVDLEYGSLCLQQDATDLFGAHEFLRFPNQRYVDEFVHRELFCFNDQDFAVVSQRNRLRGRHP